MTQVAEAFWTATADQQPPRQGRFWAWLYQTGVKLMEWRPDFHEDDDGEQAGAYVLSHDQDDDYEPKFWAPESAIPSPFVATLPTGEGG